MREEVKNMLESLSIMLDGPNQNTDVITYVRNNLENTGIFDLGEIDFLCGKLLLGMKFNSSNNFSDDELEGFAEVIVKAVMAVRDCLHDSGFNLVDRRAQYITALGDIAGTFKFG